MVKLDSFIVQGGKRLKGTVTISGSKNAALPCLFASLLTDEDCFIENVPELRDIKTAIALLVQLGKSVRFENHRVIVQKDRPLKYQASYDLVRRMRASAVVMGPLLGRLGRAQVSMPGGCAIGARPINYHLDAFRRLGAEIDIQEGYVKASAKNLRGTTIRLPFPSVGATENILMATSLASGKTTLLNAAREPEIQDLVHCLRSMGADISGEGTSSIVIRGVKNLRGCVHTVIPDRIEAGTFLIAAAISRGSIRLLRTEPSHILSLIDHLRKAGMQVRVERDVIEAEWKRPLKPMSIETRVYPGFPTDLQAQWMSLMAVISGHSRITEKIFENRFMHAYELIRMGAKIDIDGHTAHVEGVKNLSGCPLMVSDLRAGAALVLAGLAAKGKTKILRVYHLDRGYEHIERKLRGIGARIRRIPQ
ncbi:MAG TPA: UDP-N-acetylglucosamine 1-carboxyvinyltransferase [Elusimicrobiota bacterium]|nr:UDP-N-acetylglucosamine 1-carboxyvinyltransferase [Elusimicrobiota bacterium]